MDHKRNIYIASPFAELSSVDDIRKNVSMYLKGNTEEKLRIVLCHINGDISDQLSKLSLYYYVNTLSIFPEIFIIKRKFFEDKIKKQIEWLCYESAKGIYTILSFANGKHFNKYFKQFLRHTYPSISEIYLNTKAIYNIIENTSKDIDLTNIKVKKIVAKKSFYRKEYDISPTSSIEWPEDISYQQAFNKIFEEDAWLKSLDISIQYRTDDAVHETIGTISRNGWMKCSGDFDIFNYSILLHSSNYAIKEKEILKHRERTAQTLFEPRPLEIVFPQEVFKNHNENIKFINAMEKMPLSSISVYHGNPYLSASLVDHKDGSNFKIWILSDDTLTIVPQARCTSSSLDRIINHIGEFFLEGDVIDPRRAAQNEC